MNYIMSLIFKLQQKTCGFFCQVNKIASNYLYAKKHRLRFIVDDSTWLFTHHLGWRDYFTSLPLLSEESPVEPIIPEIDVEDSRLFQFTLREYIGALQDIFQLNDSVLARYQEERKKLPEAYNSIMIRRGDKMIGESRYIATSEYVNRLLEMSDLPIFVQTDDYTAYQEVCHVIMESRKDVKVWTTCPPNKRGAFVFEYQPSIGSKKSKQNHEYLMKLTNIKQKSVNQYSPMEMKEHVEEMLVGLKVCMESRYLATDFQSNVTRFLLCTHHNPLNVLYVGHVSCPLFDVPLQGIAKGLNYA
jgi:hypothetical protein